MRNAGGGLERLFGRLFVLLDDSDLCFRSPLEEEGSPEICLRCCSEGPRSKALPRGEEYERMREFPSNTGRIMGKCDSRSIMGAIGRRELCTVAKARPDAYIITVAGSALQTKEPQGDARRTGMTQLAIRMYRLSKPQTPSESRAKRRKHPPQSRMKRAHWMSGSEIGESNTQR